VDVAKVMVDIHHKKFKRPAHLSWNPVTGRFDPLICEHCRTTIREIHFLSEKSDLNIVCAACGQK
jgi:PHP family Zn ribbon phosphoesterase